jgi:RNA polymerase sigma-70 factor, ECF subfamily
MQFQKLDASIMAIDGNANAELYDHYAHVIFAYARLHLSSREDAEDVTLAVFVAALEHQNLAGLSSQEQLMWLRRVASNKLVDIYRHAQRHPVVALESLVEQLYEDEERSPEYMVLRQERYKQLHAAISTLPELQQSLLQLRFGHSLRFAEIAILLNKREDALRKLLSRTLAFLRASYFSAHREDKEYGRS